MSGGYSKGIDEAGGSGSRSRELVSHIVASSSIEVLPLTPPRELESGGGLELTISFRRWGLEGTVEWLRGMGSDGRRASVS